MTGITAYLKRDAPVRGGNTTMSPLGHSGTGVAIDIYTIRIPYDRQELLNQLWNDVDESEIPIDIRYRLCHHGFRQGILPSKIPVSLERLLELRDIQPQRLDDRASYSGNNSTGEPLHKCVTNYMMPKQTVFCFTCETIPKLPVLAVVDGYPTGYVYHNANGVILISTEEQPDGSVIVKTIPEIHYGDDTGEITSVNSAYTRKVYHSKIQFDQLAVETKLLLGQWIVIGADTQGTAGFGRNIFSQDNGVPEKVLIGIRLRQTLKDGIHDRNDIVVTRISNEQKSWINETIPDKPTQVF